MSVKTSTEQDEGKNNDKGSSEATPDKPTFGFDSLAAVCKKLLDLTGRNQLLNYKHPKASCVRIIDELPDQIYAELQTGKAFTFIPVPEPSEAQLIEHEYLRWNEVGELEELKDFPKAERWAQHLGLNTNYELPPAKSGDGDAEGKHQDLDIQTLMYANELEARLRAIRSKSETAVEESGSNVLYIALGFLEWYESRESDTKRLAPLFTLPVKLERTKLDASIGVFRYAVSLKDEGLLSNITLREKLSNDFGLALPELDDESTPEAYFERLHQTILKHEPRWKLHRMATLAILNFTKQVMYEDLDPATWPADKPIEDHPIIQQFFSSQESDDADASGFVEEYPIDQIDNVHDEYPLIFEADSSQHSALIDAAKGENLVIEGPPGSGKSQTITNLIAACIANGKRVLFVAEKMAALDVVKRRLDKAGLGDFCLELHSHKTQKLRLLEDLNNRLNMQGKYPNPSEIAADIARFEDLKEKLNRYVSAINSQWKNTGLTIHEILNRATRYREQLRLSPDAFSIDDINGENLSPVRARELVDLGEMLKSIFRQVQEQAPGGDIARHYWFGVNNADLMGHEQDTLADLLVAWNTQLQSLSGESYDLKQKFAIPDDSLVQLEQIKAFATSAAGLPDLLGGEPLTLLPTLKGQAPDLTRLLDAYESLHGDLSALETQLSSAAIKSEKAPPAIAQALGKLKALGVLESSTLADLQKDYDQLLTADATARSLAEQLTRIQESAPQTLHELTTGSLAALRELASFLELIALLPSEQWRHREPVYDEPDMDSLLGQLTSKFTTLVPVHRELQQSFKLEALTAAATLKELEDSVCNAGFFSFLSKRYWDSRKQLYSLSTSAKPDKKAVCALMPKLVAYKTELEQVDQLNRDNQVLNTLYKGMDTPLDRIVALRQWYKKVRLAYGRGLGPKAKFADALFAMERDLALALSDLAKDGFLESIRKVLGAVDKVFPSYGSSAAIEDTATSLLSDKSPVRMLLADIQTPLKNLKQCFKEDAATLAVCADMTRKLQSYQAEAQAWRDEPLARTVSPSFLSLEVSPGKHNPKALAVARNFSAILSASETSEIIELALAKDSDAAHYNGLKDAAKSLQNLVEKADKAWKVFAQLGNVNQEEWMRSSNGGLEQLIQRNVQALDKKTWLNNWLEYLRLRGRLGNEGMQNILLAVEKGTLGTNDILDVVNMVLMHLISQEVLAETPFLAEFSGMEQMAIRERFCEYDKKLLALQRQKIAFRAAQTRAPAGNASGRVSSYSEASLIRHEAGKKRGHIAVRSLIDRSGEAIQALKPCFMMSPMSVAQYIKPGQFEFDIVVMDEASQIRPEDALGSIARGKSLIVVGDPKQLPPTSFFDKMTNEEPDDDSVALEESESILESAIPMFRTRRLRWHYRSRHESLIAFSNLHYYNSDLVIFPSPYASGPEFGIRYHKISRGRFARGKNAEEARAVAHSALKQMLQNPHESIGIVAMNAEQRTEIEMHVEQLVKEDEKFKTAFDNNLGSEEPLFIKNLENVQGDERDVIMISMTYGPDDVGGKVYQRFGPINKDVGWRRLNVLFTRSKKRMYIFSSMDSYDIQVTGGSKKGVQSLRKFLEYCESGHLVSAETTGRAADSDFEIAVMNALSEKGYECVPQLGVAGYFLDLAIKDPDRDGVYLLGIECDGATYHSAKSARDRDRLRQEILESLGWRIRRIWSTDWFKNPEAQLQPILNELTTLTQDREPRRDIANPVAAEVIEPSESIRDLEVRQEDPQIIGDKSLHDILIDFDKKVIRRRFENTDPQKRLLRPAMLEALVNELPTSKEEFSLKVPGYLRSSTDVPEAREYLGEVLEIIGNYG